MASLWVYDHDIARARRWALLLGICNFIVMGLHAYARNWTVAAGALFWLISCWVWRKNLDCQQATRDMGRRIEAGLHSVRRAIETGEI